MFQISRQLSVWMDSFQEKSKERSHHHHHHSSKDKQRHRHHSSGSNNKDHKDRSGGNKDREKDKRSERRDEDGRKEKHHSSSSSKDKDRDHDRDRERDRDRDHDRDRERDKDKSKNKDREKKKEIERKKLEKLDESIKRADVFKADKLTSINMFAPKPKTVPLIISAVTPRFDRSVSGGSSSGSKTPILSPTTGPQQSRSPKVDFNGKPAAKVESSLTKSSSSQSKADSYRDLPTSPKQFGERRSLPALPVSKCDGDKLKQHKDDFNDTKRLLNEARQRRVEQLEREKEEKRRLKGQTGPAKEKFERPPKPSTPSAPSKEKVKEPEPSAKRNERLSSDKPKRKPISDSDDGSDGEWKGSKGGHSKLKHRKKSSSRAYFDDSSSGEEPVADVKDAIVSTRKSTQKSKADAVLDGDPETPVCLGFSEASGEDGKFSIDSDDADNISDSDAVDDLIPTKLLPQTHASKVIENSDKELVFIDNLSDPKKAFASANSKVFGGKPKLVSPVPDWLSAKFRDWSLKRQDVDIISPQEFNKIRNKRKIVTDREWDARCNVGSSGVDEKRMKIEDILMEQMPDIVSVTPEPMKADEMKVEPEAQASQTETEVKPEKTDETDDVGVQNELCTEQEDFRGFIKPEADFRLVFPIAEADRNGNKFGLTTFIEDDDADFAEKMHSLINPELQKHYLQLVNDDKSLLQEIQKVGVHPPLSSAKKLQRKRKAPEVNEPLSEQQPKSAKPRKRKQPEDKQQQQLSPAFSGGLKEVSDEILSESLEPELDLDLTPLKKAKQRKSAPFDHRKIKPPPPETFPMPPSPASSPPAGKSTTFLVLISIRF